MNRVLKKLALSVGLSCLLTLLTGITPICLGSFLIYILVLTGFIYGFSAVKNYLTAILAKAGHYGLSAIFFRSFWGGLLVLVLALVSLSLVIWVGVIWGYAQLVLDICHASRTSSLPESDSVELDPW